MTRPNIPRSPEMIFVGYCLARRTERSDSGKCLPPKALSVSSWNAAYDIFYPVLGDGRTPGSFRNSLKNARDKFDAFFENGRRGWLPNEALPDALAGHYRDVWQRWADAGDDELDARLAAMTPEAA